VDRGRPSRAEEAWHGAFFAEARGGHGASIAQRIATLGLHRAQYLASTTLVPLAIVIEDLLAVPLQHVGDFTLLGWAEVDGVSRGIEELLVPSQDPAVTESSRPRGGLSCRCYGGGSTVLGMDVIAILIVVAAFALLLALVEGLDRV
jgi:hypothetical protein